MLKDLNVDSMKSFARKLGLPRAIARRPDLVDALDRELQLNLPGIVARLSEIECKALALAVHGDSGITCERFKAMFGVDMPDLEPWSYRSKDPSLLLMLGEGSSWRFVVSDALLESLQRIVPKPPEATVPSLDVIPEIHHPARRGWREAAPRPVHVYQCSEIAPLELRSVLQLVRSGKLSVADKSLRPTEQVLA